MYRNTPRTRRFRSAILVAGVAVTLMACSQSADDVRADLRKQITEVGDLDDEQRSCMEGLVDGLSDEDAKEIAKATSGSEPDMENPKVAAFMEGTQGCIVTASAVKDLVLSQLPADLTTEQRSCMETYLDGLDQATLDGIASGDAATLTDALVGCAVGT